MYRKGPAFDVFLIIICIYFIKTFFLKKDLSIQEKFWIEHSNPLIRNLFVFSVLMEIAYVFLCDIGILQGVYYLYVSGLMIFNVLLSLSGICFLRMKFGPKNWKYRYGTKMGLEAIVSMVLIYVLMYFFWDY